MLKCSFWFFSLFFFMVVVISFASTLNLNCQWKMFTDNRATNSARLLFGAWWCQIPWYVLRAQPQKYLSYTEVKSWGWASNSLLFMQTRPLILTNSLQAETNLSPPRVLGKVAFLDSWQLLEESQTLWSFLLFGIVCRKNIKLIKMSLWSLCEMRLIFVISSRDWPWKVGELVLQLYSMHFIPQE